MSDLNIPIACNFPSETNKRRRLRRGNRGKVLSKESLDLVESLLSEEREHGHGVSLNLMTKDDWMGFQGIGAPEGSEAPFIGELNLDGNPSIVLVGASEAEPSKVVVCVIVDTEDGEASVEATKTFPDLFSAKKFVASELGEHETVDHLIDLGFFEG